MSQRTLTILSAAVAVLAIVVLLDRPRLPEERSDRVLPGLVPREISRLEIRDVVLERRGEGFALVAPQPLEADEDAVRDLLGTLEYLAYRRTIPKAGFEPRFTVRVGTGAHTRELRVGAADPALGLTRVAVGDRTYLVEDWQAHALDRSLDDLRRREALRVTRPIMLEQGGAKVVLRGDPPCVELNGGCARADAERVGRLEQALGELRLTRFVAKGPPAATARIAAGAETVVVGGPCPGASGEVLIASPAGPGCVAEEALAAILEEARPALTWVDRALLSPGEPKQITIEEAGRKLTIEDMGAEGPRAWLEELAAFRAVEVVAAPPAEPGTPRLSVDGQVLWLAQRLGDRLEVRRAGEPVALIVDAEAARFFQADELAFRDRAILGFEPTALREVTRPAETAVRGESIDDWHLTRPVTLPADPDAVEALREAAAHLRAERFVARAPVAAHRLAAALTFVVDPPPTAPEGAAPERQTILLGADTEGGCFAQRQGEAPVFLLAAATCRTLRAPLVTREIVSPPLEAVTSLTIGASRYQKEGERWHRQSGVPLSIAEGTALESLVQALREAPEALGYGDVRGRTRIQIEAGAEKVEVLLSPTIYGVAGRPVRYRLAPEACTAWPAICR